MPARLRDLMRVLAEYEIEFERPNSGSHWKARGPGGLTYPVPAGNAEKTEIGDNYIRALCRTFGLDFRDIKNLL